MESIGSITALAALLLVGLFHGSGKQSVEPVRPASAPAVHWVPVPAFSDEFNGKTLDAEKWHPKNPGWEGRPPAPFCPENVSVKDGALHIAIKKEEPVGYSKEFNTYTSGAVKSKTTVLYGFFEARCKAAKSVASSGYWFYDVTEKEWTEIDIFEINGLANKVHMTVHKFDRPIDPETKQPKLVDDYSSEAWEAPTLLSDAYHVYGLEWNANEVIFYIDGVERRRVKNMHWHQPLALNFDLETQPGWFGLPKPEELPATFSIDYIRAWKAAEK